MNYPYVRPQTDIQLKVGWHKRGFLLPHQMPHTLIVCTVGIGLDGRKPEAQLLQQKLGLASVMRTPNSRTVRAATPRLASFHACLNQLLFLTSVLDTYVYVLYKSMALESHQDNSPEFL